MSITGVGEVKRECTGIHFPQTLHGGTKYFFEGRVKT